MHGWEGPAQPSSSNRVRREAYTLDWAVDINGWGTNSSRATRRYSRVKRRQLSVGEKAYGWTAITQVSFATNVRDVSYCHHAHYSPGAY